MLSMGSVFFCAFHEWVGSFAFSYFCFFIFPPSPDWGKGGGEGDGLTFKFPFSWRKRRDLVFLERQVDSEQVCLGDHVKGVEVWVRENGWGLLLAAKRETERMRRKLILR